VSCTRKRAIPAYPSMRKLGVAQGSQAFKGPLRPEIMDRPARALNGPGNRRAAFLIGDASDGAGDKYVKCCLCKWLEADDLGRSGFGPFCMSSSPASFLARVPSGLARMGRRTLVAFKRFAVTGFLRCRCLEQVG
jgi:hypothetical protein